MVFSYPVARVTFIYQKQQTYHYTRRIFNMDKEEMDRRCDSAEVRGTINFGESYDCRVYSRWVRDCGDCSFNPERLP